MSKAQAIEGVMKIFLMVAVIIVGMSFLLKAFGIDLIGWLMDKLGGLGIPESGKALHIKSKIGGANKDVWEFHLLSEKELIKHFTDEDKTLVGLTTYSLYYQIETDKNKNELIGKNCLVLTDEERPGQDRPFIYYVVPGTLIQKNSCTFLKDCLSKKIEESGCSPRQVIQKNPECTQCDVRNGKENVACPDKFGVVNCAREPVFHNWPECDTKELVLNEFEFGENIKISDKCAKDNPKNCNLLDYKEIKGQAFFGSNVKFGLLCADNGNWHTCRQQTGSRSIQATVKGQTISCGPGDGVFVWDESKTNEAFTSSLFKITLTSVGGDDSFPYTTTDATPIIEFSTEENARCRISHEDKSYDDMGSSLDCSQTGYTSHKCSLTTVLKKGENKVFVSCRDNQGNRHTSSNNLDISLTIE